MVKDARMIIPHFFHRLEQTYHCRRAFKARLWQDVYKALEQATRECGREKAYRKGKRSLQALAQLNPTTLQQYLPHFRRLVTTLERYLLRESQQQVYARC
jgi:hypothetical protein